MSVPEAKHVLVTDNTIRAELSDGRSIAAPLARYARLVRASQQGRDNWEMIVQAQGVHWPDEDEDISVEGLMADKPAEESQRAFKR